MNHCSLTLTSTMRFADGNTNLCTTFYMSLETGKDFSEISFEGVIKANDISLGNVVEMFGISPGDGGDYEGMVFESIEDRTAW